jgi:hypothetical protein
MDDAMAFLSYPLKESGFSSTLTQSGNLFQSALMRRIAFEYLSLQIGFIWNFPKHFLLLSLRLKCKKRVL